MKKFFAIVVLGAFLLTSTSIPSSFAADEGSASDTSTSAAETVATTEAKNAGVVGVEGTAVLSIIGGVIILGAIAISSESAGEATAHRNGHGHGH